MKVDKIKILMKKNSKNKSQKINFKSKKVLIMGLGLHGGGVGAVKFFAKQNARVLVTDLRTRSELKESLSKLKEFKNIKYVLGKHRVKDFKNTDLIVKNPGVPKNSKYLKIAKKHKIPINTDIGLFFEFCLSDKIIGITGTKGKSTTAALTASILKTKYNTVLAGNIRMSVLGQLSKIKKDTVVVLELSSWQLEDFKNHKKSPHVAVITNIMQDHLNRHKNLNDYIKAKKLIFKFQNSDDLLILNNDDKIVRKFANESKSKAIFFSKLQAINYLKYIKLLGEHNLYNISAAITTAKIFKIPELYIKKALKKFRGIEGRLELVKTSKEIKYYNDTAATTPEAVIAALSSFPLRKNIILVAGGTDKNLNFTELIKEIIKPLSKGGKIKKIILLPGTATQKILKIEPRLDAFRAKNMREAVKVAKKEAERGDVVLLSPGCASFGLFQHEFDRGKQFEDYI